MITVFSHEVAHTRLLHSADHPPQHAYLTETLTFLLNQSIPLNLYKDKNSPATTLQVCIQPSQHLISKSITDNPSTIVQATSTKHALITNTTDLSSEQNHKRTRTDSGVKHKHRSIA